MAKGTRICKVCGAEYAYCKTNRPTGTFRWQDVACSPEHGSIYLFRIMESRSKKSDPEPDPVKAGDAIAAVEARLAKQKKDDNQEKSAVDDVIDVVEENDELVACESTDAVYETEEPVEEATEDEDTERLSDTELDDEYDDDEDDYDEEDDEDDWLDDGDEDENN